MPRTWMHGRYSKGWMENLPETHESIGAFLGKIRARVGEPSNPETSGNDLLTEYCLECDAMHEDLDFLLYEMDLSVTRPHETALDDRRMALLYHMDNFTLRIAAYREKVFQLVNQVLGLGVDPEDRRLRERVHHLLRERGWPSIDDLLLRFDRDSTIATIVEQRHALLHRIAFRPSETLRALSRIFMTGFNASSAPSVACWLSSEQISRTHSERPDPQRRAEAPHKKRSHTDLTNAAR